jgi:hypothetical protein
MRLLFCRREGFQVGKDGGGIFAVQAVLRHRRGWPLASLPVVRKVMACSSVKPGKPASGVYSAQLGLGCIGLKMVLAP